LEIESPKLLGYRNSFGPQVTGFCLHFSVGVCIYRRVACANRAGIL